MTGSEIAGLRTQLERLGGVDSNGLRSDDAREAIERLLDALEAGSIRAAEPGQDGRWKANGWVKSGILAAFRLGKLSSFESGSLSFVDLDTFPPRHFDETGGVRIVPGGSAVRRGSHLGRGTICMPPSYVNVGAYVGDGSMVDSHALVGSCAQIGSRVHLSAAVQIGGVLEPPGALPVIVEDDVFVGGGCGIYEGCMVRQGAVLAPGVILSRSTPVYDLVNERVVRAGDDGRLEIPSRAVVVPGSRPASTEFARSESISLYAPVIVKYRDAVTDAATALEDGLRGHVRE